MKSLFVSSKKIVVLFFSLALFSSMKVNKDVNFIEIKEAILKKIIQVDFVSNGKYQGNSIKMNIKCNKNSAIKILVPAGSYFLSEAEDEQDLVTPVDQFFTLAPNSNSSKIVNGYCCQANNKCPKENKKFKLIDRKLPLMNKLSELIKNKNYEHSVLQDVVWSISDKKPLSNITSTNNPNEIKKLREELAILTGLKNDWFESPQLRTVDVYGNINRETIKIQGNLDLVITKEGFIHQEVQDSSGKVLMKSNQKFSVKKGKLTYFFNVKVTGWKKGNYSVRLYNNSEIIHEQSFEV
jgi:hypothetical protein